MSKFHCVAVAAILLALTQGVFAATATQTGTYLGTLKTKVRTVSGVTSVKSTMQVEIALDNTTTVTVNNILQIAGSAYYGTNEGAFAFADSSLPAPGSEVSLATAKFKNSTMTGATASFTFNNTLPPDGLIKTSTGKFKLKKQ